MAKEPTDIPLTLFGFPTPDAEADAYFCVFCESPFRHADHSTPRTLVIEDDGRDLLLAFVCPECAITHNDRLADAERLYDEWAAQHDHPRRPPRPDR